MEGGKPALTQMPSFVFNKNDGEDIVIPNLTRAGFLNTSTRRVSSRSLNLGQTFSKMNLLNEEAEAPERMSTLGSSSEDFSLQGDLASQVNRITGSASSMASSISSPDVVKRKVPLAFPHVGEKHKKFPLRKPQINSRKIFFLGGEAENTELKDAKMGFSKLSGKAERLAETNRMNALQRGVERVHKDREPANFYEIIDADESSQFPPDFSDKILGALIESEVFQQFIFYCILISTLMSILATDGNIVVNYGGVITFTDNVFLAVFVIELVFRLRYNKRQFWQDYFNWLDFILVTVSFLGLFIIDLGFSPSVGREINKFLRMMRNFRVLRLLGAIKKLQVVVNTFCKSVIDLSYILIFTILIMFMFSVLGVQLLGDIVPQHFGDLNTCMYTLFIMITQDGWMAIWLDLDATFTLQGTSPDFISYLYFIMFILAGAWICVNIISGITVTNWQLFSQELKEEQHERFHAIENYSKTEGIFNTRSIAEVDSEVWGKQLPLFPNARFGLLPVEQVENYTLVLSAIKKNLDEFQMLKGKMNNFLTEIDNVNTVINGTERIKQESFEVPDMRRRRSSTHFSAGDALSEMQTRQPELVQRSNENCSGGQPSLLKSILRKSE